ncbi:N-acetyl-gamma-glutamyl-phosphate reductase [Erythrobacter sp. Alg231-14]|uniref:N-acetyl-gamma-glutamyl-phosphate reductase n=1 Tax=Erythrobacter sp. Alg231-14 TaxID=1922225 RepID=UPI000D54D2EC
MTTKIFIDGAAGTTGLEIRDRLTGREEFSLIVLDDAQRKDEATRKDALHSADVAILCLPDAAAIEAVQLAEGSDTRIIDASSAHRVADDWTYGFPEIVGQDHVAQSQLVSNPGCYPTGFLALVTPLVRAGLLPTSYPFSVNAVSGYSGGGNALIDRFNNEPNLAFRTYGLAHGHKHLPEMQTYSGIDGPPVFSPSVIAAHRGMVVDTPIVLSALPGRVTSSDLQNTLNEFYASSPLVKVASGLPSEITLSQGAEPWDGLELFVSVAADQSHARLIARLDNLGKGASGAAIQNLNIMCGLPETAGLRI